MQMISIASLTQYVNLMYSGLPVSLQEKKFWKGFFLKKKVKKVFFRHRIKPFKYVDRLKGTPCDQS